MLTRVFKLDWQLNSLELSRLVTGSTNFPVPAHLIMMSLFAGDMVRNDTNRLL